MEQQLTKYDSLRDGPLKERGCTDILCALIFFAFVGAMITLGIFGYKNGDPDMILYPYDSSGNQCGRPGTVGSLYQYVYFVNPDEDIRYKVCLKFCVEEDFETPLVIHSDCVLENSFVSLNNNEFVVTLTDKSGTSTSKSYPLYSAHYFIMRACVPHDASETFTAYLEGTTMMSYESDIVRCGHMVLVVLGIAVVISMVYLLLMRYFID